MKIHVCYSGFFCNWFQKIIISPPQRELEISGRLRRGGGEEESKTPEIPGGRGIGRSI